MKITPMTFVAKILGIITYGLWYFLEAAIVGWLWNNIVATNFMLPMLGYWEMYGILWMISIVFGKHYISYFGEDEKCEKDQ